MITFFLGENIDAQNMSVALGDTSWGTSSTMVCWEITECIRCGQRWCQLLTPVFRGVLCSKVCALGCLGGGYNVKRVSTMHIGSGNAPALMYWMQWQWKPDHSVFKADRIAQGCRKRFPIFSGHTLAPVQVCLLTSSASWNNAFNACALILPISGWNITCRGLGLLLLHWRCLAQLHVHRSTWCLLPLMSLVVGRI